MEDRLYQELINIELNNLVNLLEDLDDSIDVDLISGVLTITLSNNKQYVINKHEVTKKIWMSSPFSGASYYLFNENKNSWIDENNTMLSHIVTQEITDHLKQNI